MSANYRIVEVKNPHIELTIRGLVLYYLEPLITDSLNFQSACL